MPTTRIFVTNAGIREVINAEQNAVNYELRLLGKTTSSVPSGLSGFLACDIGIIGVSIA